jgi:hypothetical protein
MERERGERGGEGRQNHAASNDTRTQRGKVWETGHASQVDTYCVSNTHHDHGKDDHEGESVNQEHLRSKRKILAILKTSVIMIYNTFI